MKLKIHSLAEMIPAMSEEEYLALRADIKENGQREPITLYNGEILDGRHRSRACEELDLQPALREYTGDQPGAYVLSLNVRRRNLTPSQCAAVAAEFLPQLEAEAKDRQRAAGEQHGRGMNSSGSSDPELLQEPRRAREDAGALVGVSGASVDRARRVKEQAPEDFEKVKAGELAVRTASEKLAKSGSPKKNGKRAERRSSQQLSNLVHTFTNTHVLLRETNVEAALQTINSEEAAKWAEQLRRVRTDLSRLITVLEGAS